MRRQRIPTSSFILLLVPIGLVAVARNAMDISSQKGKSARDDDALRESVSTVVEEVWSDGSVDSVRRQASLTLAEMKRRANEEPMDLVVRMPGHLNQAFAMICSRLCVGNCSKSCACFDIVDELDEQTETLINDNQANASVWASIVATLKSVSHRFKFGDMCKTLRDRACEEASACAHKARAVLASGPASPASASSILSLPASDVRAFVDWASSTTYGESSTHVLQMVLDAALDTYNSSSRGLARAGTFVDIGCGRGKMLAFACLLPSTRRVLSSCVGVEVLQERVDAAAAYLSALQVPLKLALGIISAAVAVAESVAHSPWRMFRERDMERDRKGRGARRGEHGHLFFEHGQERLRTRGLSDLAPQVEGISIVHGDMADGRLASRVLQGATIVYIYNLLMGKDLTGVVLRAVVHNCLAGTRVVLHTTISDQPQDIRDAFEVLAVGFGQRPAQKAVDVEKRRGALHVDGSYGSKRFLGTPCVLELLHPTPRSQ